MFKGLYKKSLKLAAHKSSKFFLSLVAFAESSFFPIPPDIMIVPMIIAKKNDYFKIFLIATFSSSLGGLLGYYLGITFLDLSMGLIEFYGYEQKLIELKADLNSGESFYIFLGALFLAGFTPLPFKVFTITSGMIGFNILIFFFICLVSRGLRFFVVSYLSYKFEYTFNRFMERNSEKFFMIGCVLIFTVIVILYLLLN